MRIAHILWSGNLAGAEKYVVHLVGSMKSQQPHSESIIIFISKAYDLSQTLEANSVSYVELKSLSGYDPVGIVKLLFTVFRHKFDIIHVHEQTAILIQFLKLFRSPRIVYTEHSSILSHGLIRRWLYRKSVTQYDCVFFVSKAQRRALAEKIRLNARKEVVIPLGVDLNVYNSSFDKHDVRRKLGFKKDACIIGYVGRFDRFKNVDKVVEAVGILRTRIPNVRLLVVGFGKNLSALRDKVVDRGISDITDLLITPNLLLDFQQSLDFLVHPSEHESLGLSVLEAMALGKVAIVNNFESAGEIISNGVDGVILENITPPAIADTIATLWTKRALCEEIGKNAIKKIRSCYDFERHTERLLAEYGNLITR